MGNYKVERLDNRHSDLKNQIESNKKLDKERPTWLGEINDYDNYQNYKDSYYSRHNSKNHRRTKPDHNGSQGFDQYKNAYENYEKRKADEKEEERNSNVNYVNNLIQWENENIMNEKFIREGNMKELKEVLVQQMQEKEAKKNNKKSEARFYGIGKTGIQKFRPQNFDQRKLIKDRDEYKKLQIHEDKKADEEMIRNLVDNDN